MPHCPRACVACAMVLSLLTHFSQKMAVQKQEIRKKSIFFKLGSLLPPDASSALPDAASAHAKKLASAFSGLKKLEKNGSLGLYLVAGQEREKAMGKISPFGLGGIFAPERMLFVTKEYLLAKEEIDRERHIAHLEADPQFVDEYFTQQAILGLMGSGKVIKEQAVLVGNDLWFDGFYTMRFSGIDFVLVRERLTERNAPIAQRLEGLNYISFSGQDMGKVAAWDFAQNNLRMLQNYIMDKLSRELLKDVDFSGLAQKACQKRGAGS